MRRFTGETVERYHLTPVVSTTDSGVEVRKLIILLMVAMGKKVINNGSMFQD